MDDLRPPVLVELVRRLECEGEQRVYVPVAIAVGELTEQPVGAALRRLRDGGFVHGRGVATFEHPFMIVALTARALQAVGAWPPPKQLVDRLLAALANAAERGRTDERRS